jgi:hypothetical protein
MLLPLQTATVLPFYLMAGIDSEKTMFEVYRENAYSGEYRVVYYTELEDHNKETEINRAVAGEHFVDGFLRNYNKDDAKKVIDELLGRLNNGEQIPPQEFLGALGDHLG